MYSVTLTTDDVAYYDVYRKLARLGFDVSRADGVVRVTLQQEAESRSEASYMAGLRVLSALSDIQLRCEECKNLNEMSRGTQWLFIGIIGILLLSPIVVVWLRL